MYARPNENKLQIDYLELSDSGVYECYLSNDPRGGGATSRVTLRVREIEQDEFGTNSNYYSREEDYKLPAEASGESRIDKSRSENVEIACGLTSNYQLVRWRKLNGVIVAFTTLFILMILHAIARSALLGILFIVRKL